MENELNYVHWKTGMCSIYLRLNVIWKDFEVA